MDIFDSFPSKYLKAADLNGRPLRATISDVEVQNVGGQNKEEDYKPVLYLRNEKKGIVLNKTNATILGESLGRETDGWTGKEVEAYPDKTTFQGKLVACLRLRVPRDEPDDPLPLT